jgi:serine/threonine protein kinase
MATANKGSTADDDDSDDVPPAKAASVISGGDVAVGGVLQTRQARKRFDDDSSDENGQAGKGKLKSNPMPASNRSSTVPRAENDSDTEPDEEAARNRGFAPYGGATGDFVDRDGDSEAGSEGGDEWHSDEEYSAAAAAAVAAKAKMNQNPKGLQQLKLAQLERRLTRARKPEEKPDARPHRPHWLALEAAKCRYAVAREQEKLGDAYGAFRTLHAALSALRRAIAWHIGSRAALTMWAKCVDALAALYSKALGRQQQNSALPSFASTLVRCNCHAIRTMRDATLKPMVAISLWADNNVATQGINALQYAAARAADENVRRDASHQLQMVSMLRVDAAGNSMPVTFDVVAALEHTSNGVALYRTSELKSEEVLHDYAVFLDCIALATNQHTPMARPPPAKVVLVVPEKVDVATRFGAQKPIKDAPWPSAPAVGDSLPRTDDAGAVFFDGDSGAGERFTGSDMSGRAVAIRKLPTGNSNAQASLARYTAVQALAHCSNIARTVACIEHLSHLHIVEEHTKGSRLSALLAELRVDEQQIAFFTQQILRALAYAHARGIVHGDVRSYWMLLDLDGTLRVSGFVSPRPRMQADVKDAARWMAPEALSMQIYGEAGDVWGFGRVVADMADVITERVTAPPLNTLFQHATRGVGVGVGTDTAVASGVGAMHVAAAADVRWSSSLRDMIERCGRVSPADRPTIAALRQHTFFRTHESDLEEPEFRPKLLRLLANMNQ